MTYNNTYGEATVTPAYTIKMTVNYTGRTIYYKPDGSVDRDNEFQTNNTFSFGIAPRYTANAGDIIYELDSDAYFNRLFEFYKKSLIYM